VALRFSDVRAARGFIFAVRSQAALRMAIPADDLEALPDGGGLCGRFYSRCLASWGERHLVTRREGRTVKLHVAGYPEREGRVILRVLLGAVADQAPEKAEVASLLAERDRCARELAAGAVEWQGWPDGVKAAERMSLKMMIDDIDLRLDLPNVAPQLTRIRRHME
jgi:hypothetical protein